MVKLLDLSAIEGSLTTCIAFENDYIPYAPQRGDRRCVKGTNGYLYRETESLLYCRWGKRVSVF